VLEAMKVKGSEQTKEGN